MTVKLLTKYHLEFLSLKGGCKGSSESTHVKMPYCWKSDVLVQLWASTRENLSSGVFEQHRRRPACASAKSDQRLFIRFLKSIISRLATSEILNFYLVPVAE